MESSELGGSAWVEVLNGPVCLHCWWAKPGITANDIESELLINRAYIVLPEVFGVNAWVRSVVDWLALGGPLFARTAPELELAYDRTDLVEGRRHKDATTA